LLSDVSCRPPSAACVSSSCCKNGKRRVIGVDGPQNEKEKRKRTILWCMSVCIVRSMSERARKRCKEKEKEKRRHSQSVEFTAK
jgi:hypothetical protein